MHDANLWSAAIHCALQDPRSARALSSLDVVSVHTDGSLILAKAIIAAVGAGSLIRIEHKGRTVRYGARVHDAIYDAGGIHDCEFSWTKHCLTLDPECTKVVCGIDWRSEHPDDNRVALSLAHVILDHAEQIAVENIKFDCTPSHQ